MTKFKNKTKAFALTKKAPAFLGAALMLLIALIFTACKQPAAPEPAPAPPSYTSVAFADLDTHLKTKATEAGLNYIEVTGLTEQDLEGEASYPPKPSPLGKILNANPTKKVALKFGDIAYLRDMRYCFWLCQSLVQVAAIPEGVRNLEYCFTACQNLVSVAAIPKSVTNMESCFDSCKSLTYVSAIPASVQNMRSCFSSCESLKYAPEIPQGVQNMVHCFSHCTALTSVVLKCNYIDRQFMNIFLYCTSLGNGSIKVPQDYYGYYTADAALTQMNVPGENPAEQKAKFAKIKP